MSNQRECFLHGLFILQIRLIKSAEYAWPQNNPNNKSMLIWLMLFSFFPRVCPYSTEYKESLAWRYTKQSDLCCFYLFIVAIRN